MLVLISTACHFGQRTRTVRISNDHSTLKIEYCGEIIFNDSGTAIKAISPDGYVRYKKDDKKFFAESNEEGEISYKLSDGNMSLNYKGAENADFRAAIVKEIARHYYH